MALQMLLPTVHTWPRDTAFAHTPQSQWVFAKGLGMTKVGKHLGEKGQAGALCVVAPLQLGLL